MRSRPSRVVSFYGATPLPLYMRVSLANDFIVSEYDVGGYFQLYLQYGEYDSAYSDEFYPPEGTITAQTLLDYAFVFVDLTYGSAYYYSGSVTIRWHYGDGSAVYAPYMGFSHGDPDLAVYPTGQPWGPGDEPNYMDEYSMWRLYAPPL